MSDRSEKWQDSERGQAYEQWKGEYEGNHLEEIDLDMPDALEVTLGDQAETLSSSGVIASR